MKVVIWTLALLALAAPPARADDLHERAAQGDVEACKSLGATYERMGNRALGVSWWRKAAEKGDQNALLVMSERLRLGVGVPRNLRQSADYLARANPLSPAEMALRLGTLAQGRGDQAKALAAFRQAAEAGLQEGQRKYGLVLAASGARAEALAWLAKAAAEDDPEANLALGELLATAPTPAERERAKACWAKAVEDIDEQAAWAPRAYMRAGRLEMAAQVILHQALEPFEDVPRLDDDGADLAALAPQLAELAVAARQGSGPACFALAQLARANGRGEASEAEARNWLAKGAAARHLPSALQLADQAADPKGRPARYAQAFAGINPAHYEVEPAALAYEVLRSHVEEMRARYTISDFPWTGFDLGPITDLASARAFWERVPVGTATIAAGRSGVEQQLKELPPVYFQHVSLASVLWRKARFAEDATRARDFERASAVEGNLLAQYKVGLDLIQVPSTRANGLALLALSAAQGHRGAARALDREEAAAGPALALAGQEEARRWWEAVYR